MPGTTLRARCHHAIRGAFSEHLVWFYRRHPELLLASGPEHDARMAEEIYVLQRLLEKILACVDECVEPAA
jgi:hypothetical protein